jgi:ABC-type glycerol-3-phosphate transport system substrate-binding protein
MAQIGGTIPETVAELEALCDLAVAAEYICMGLGNLGAWGSEGYWINLAYNNLALGDYAGFTRGIFEGEPGVPWGGEEVGKALETFVEWEQKGYFNEEYNAIAENDIPQEFLRGDMLLLWYWSEVNPTLTEANPEFAIGFFNFPQEYPDAPVLSLTGASSNWSIPIDAEHRDAGIEFMDFLLSAEAGQYLAGQGLMPILAADYSGVELPAPWVPEQLTALAEQTFMGWSNFSTPGLGGVTGPEVQKLLAGDTTIEEVLAAFQAAYEAGAAEIRGE